MELSEKIKKLRKERGMTLEQVGNIVGVGRSTVRKWENGSIANMRRDKIAKLAEALGTTPSYLMGWEEKENTQDDNISNKLIWESEFAYNEGFTDKQVGYIIRFAKLLRDDLNDADVEDLFDYAKYLTIKRKR